MIQGIVSLLLDVWFDECLASYGGWRTTGTVLRFDGFSSDSQSWVARLSAVVEEVSGLSLKEVSVENVVKGADNVTFALNVYALVGAGLFLKSSLPELGLAEGLQLHLRGVDRPWLDCSPECFSRPCSFGEVLVNLDEDCCGSCHSVEEVSYLLAVSQYVLLEEQYSRDVDCFTEGFSYALPARKPAHCIFIWALVCTCV
jgi:hypothetical protein